MPTVQEPEFYTIKKNTANKISKTYFARSPLLSNFSGEELSENIPWIPTLNLQAGGSFRNTSILTYDGGEYFSVEIVDNYKPNENSETFPHVFHYTCIKEMPEETTLEIFSTPSSMDNSIYVSCWCHYLAYNNVSEVSIPVVFSRRISGTGDFSEKEATFSPKTSSIIQWPYYWTDLAKSGIWPTSKVSIKGPVPLGSEFYIIGVGAYGIDFVASGDQYMVSEASKEETT